MAAQRDRGVGAAQVVGNTAMAAPACVSSSILIVILRAILVTGSWPPRKGAESFNGGAKGRRAPEDVERGDVNPCSSEEAFVDPTGQP